METEMQLVQPRPLIVKCCYFCSSAEASMVKKENTTYEDHELLQDPIAKWQIINPTTY
jgi:hypothetical protein